MLITKKEFEKTKKYNCTNAYLKFIGKIFSAEMP
jgi:hypothetical protein